MHTNFLGRRPLSLFENLLYEVKIHIYIKNPGDIKATYGQELSIHRFDYLFPQAFC